MDEWRKLVDDLRDTLDHEAENIIVDNQYPEDSLHEYVDSQVPVYNSDLIDLLGDNHELAVLDDPGLAEGENNIHKRIAISAYEKLLQEAHEWLEEKKEEFKCEDCDDLAKLEEVEFDGEGLRLCKSCIEYREEEKEGDDE